jgi:hypothetical protein
VLFAEFLFSSATGALSGVASDRVGSLDAENSQTLSLFLLRSLETLCHRCCGVLCHFEEGHEKDVSPRFRRAEHVGQMT